MLVLPRRLTTVGRGDAPLGEKVMQIHGPASVHGPHNISAPHALRGPQPNAPAQAPVDTGDVLELSDAAQLASRLSEIPDVRMDRIQAIRAAIAEGVYETDEKLNVALDRLLDEIA
jgi:negative regulator of flagellin synthesis FlgM